MRKTNPKAALRKSLKWEKSEVDQLGGHELVPNLPGLETLFIRWRGDKWGAHTEEGLLLTWESLTEAKKDLFDGWWHEVEERLQPAYELGFAWCKS